MCMCSSNIYHPRSQEVYMLDWCEDYQRALFARAEERESSFTVYTFIFVHTRCHRPPPYRWPILHESPIRVRVSPFVAYLCSCFFISHSYLVYQQYMCFACVVCPWLLDTHFASFFGLRLVIGLACC